MKVKRKLKNELAKVDFFFFLFLLIKTTKTKKKKRRLHPHKGDLFTNLCWDRD